MNAARYETGDYSQRIGFGTGAAEPPGDPARVLLLLLKVNFATAIARRYNLAFNDCQTATQGALHY